VPISTQFGSGTKKTSVWGNLLAESLQNWKKDRAGDEVVLSLGGDMGQKKKLEGAGRIQVSRAKATGLKKKHPGL